MNQFRSCLSVVAAVAVLGTVSPTAVVAWDWEAHGTLGPGDPTFNRPSTSFPPCALSSNGTGVYYDVHSGYWPGGYARVTASGTINRPVIASYPAGGFDPTDPCNNIVVAGGCEPLPFSIIGPFLGAPGNYDIVVTHCYNGDSGTYDFYFEVVLFYDGFESGNFGGWSSTD
ncbi:MAG: hypothetical protein V2I67_18830 [Thermoanaerobaculales bacterium]|jgi:hypothetical protein|nr:hypothetical protein [Thermoanaerobaculales bacterium]